MTLRVLDAAQDAYLKALEVARKADLEQDESNWLGNLGSLALMADDVGVAIRYYTDALELSRRTGDLRSLAIDLGNLATAYSTGQHWDEALEHRLEAVRIAEQEGDPRWLYEQRRRLRDFYLDLGLWRRAVAADAELARAGERPPPALPSRPSSPIARDGDPPFSAADEEFAVEFEAWVSRGDLSNARSRVDAELARRPESAHLWFDLGLVLNEFGEFRASLDAYDRALALAPRWLTLHHNALNSWYRLGDLEPPRRRYEQAVVDDPFDPVPRTALALVESMLGRHDEAVREATEAIRLDPLSPGVRRAAGLILSQASTETMRFDWNGAWTLFERIVTNYLALAEISEDERAGALTELAVQAVRMTMPSALANPAPRGAVIGDREAWAAGIAVASATLALDIAPEYGRAKSALGNLRPLDGFGSSDDLAEPGVGDVSVAPGDVAADHAGLLAVAGMVGAVESEVAQRGELGLDPVQPGPVKGHVGQLDIVRRCPVPDAGIGLGRQVG
jgi:tetratricopeptide (TPR) repeat protein